MSNRLRVLAVVLSLACAGEARAAELEAWGFLDIRIASLPEIEVPAFGWTLVNGTGSAGHLSSLSLSPGFFAISDYVVPVTDPIAQPVEGIRFTGSAGAARFTRGPAGFGGVMAIGGVAKVCLFGPCSAAVGNIVVPLDVAGVGGVAFVSNAASAVNATVVGAPWTTGTVAIGTLTAMGGAAPASSTGANGGVLTLVTPVFVSTNVGNPDAALYPIVARLEMSFVPEPGTIVLLGTGLVGLLAVARRNGAR